MLASAAWLAATSASTASGAAGGRRPLFNFDPSSTLGWSVPLILFAPFLLFALTVFSVRYRRSASNVGLFAFLISLATVLLVGWAQFNKAKPYTTSFPYLQLSLPLTAARFQNFNLDLSIRIDHLAVASLVAVYALGAFCLLWHRAAGRDEQGPVRFQAAMLLFAFAAAGVVVSPDLTELLAFWGMAGVASYLLVAHRWGSRDVSRGAQASLWLPFAGDLCLLLGLGLLYSRYGGPLVPDRLAGVGVLHSTPGAGLKSLTAACLLILAGVLVRAGVAPFHAWSAGTRDAPPAALAYLQAVWPLLGALLLYRSLPLLAGAGPQALRVAAYACLVGAGLGPLLGLVGNDARRVVGLAGAGAVALLMFALWQPVPGPRGAWAGAAGLAGFLALGPARAAVLLAVSSMGLQMRSFSLADMGQGWARMPGSSAALGLGGLAISLAAVAAAASAGGDLLGGAGLGGLHFSSLSRRQLVFAAGLLAAGLVVWRAFVVIGFGPLPRRRAFEPARVREVAWQMAGGALLCGLMGAAAVAVTWFTGWLDFLEVGRHAAVTVRTLVPWLIPPLLGGALAAAGYLVARQRLLGLSSRAAAETHRVRSIGLALLRRFIAQPGPGLVERLEVAGFGGAESGVGAAMRRLGRLGLERLPGLPVVLAVGVLGVLALALLAPGVRR